MLLNYIVVCWHALDIETLLVGYIEPDIAGRDSRMADCKLVEAAGSRSLFIQATISIQLEKY